MRQPRGRGLEHNLTFAKQGESLRGMMVYFEEIRTRYRSWRHRGLCFFFESALPPQMRIELSVDYDAEEGLADFWGISLYREEEYYLPSHWLVESFVEIEKSVWAADWIRLRDALLLAKIDMTEELWCRLQELKILVEEDLAYWSENVLFFDFTELETE